MHRLGLTTLCLLGCSPSPPSSADGPPAQRVFSADAGPLMPGDGAVAGNAPEQDPPDGRTQDEPRDATAEPSGTLQTVRIIRGEPTQTTWFDLTLVASGLEEYDGAVVNVRIGSPDRPPERLGSGQARIAGGAFEMSFPDVLEPGLYKFKRFFIDVNGNGSCDTGEPVYSNARAATADLTLAITPGPTWIPRDGRPCADLSLPWPED